MLQRRVSQTESRYYKEQFDAVMARKQHAGQRGRREGGVFYGVICDYAENCDGS
jgi:hypothetical protein